MDLKFRNRTKRQLWMARERMLIGLERMGLCDQLKWTNAGSHTQRAGGSSLTASMAQLKVIGKERREGEEEKKRGG